MANTDPFSPYLQQGQAQETGAQTYQVDMGANAADEATRALRYSGLMRSQKPDKPNDLITAANQLVQTETAGAADTYNAIKQQLNDMGADTAQGLDPANFEKYKGQIKLSTEQLQYLDSTQSRVRMNAVYSGMQQDPRYQQMSPQQQQELQKIFGKDPYRMALEQSGASTKLIQDVIDTYGEGPHTAYDIYTVQNRNRVKADMSFHHDVMQNSYANGQFDTNTFNLYASSNINSLMGIELNKLKAGLDQKSFITDEETIGYNIKLNQVRDVLYSQLDQAQQAVRQGGGMMSGEELDKAKKNIDDSIQSWREGVKMLYGKDHDVSWTVAAEGFLKASVLMPEVYNGVDVMGMLKMLKDGGYTPDMLTALLSKGGDTARDVAKAGGLPVLPTDSAGRVLAVLSNTVKDMISGKLAVDPDHPNFTHYLAAKFANVAMPNGKTPDVSFTKTTVDHVNELPVEMWGNGLANNAQATKNLVLQARGGDQQAQAGIDRLNVQAKNNTVMMLGQLSSGDLPFMGHRDYQVYLDPKTNQYVVNSQLKLPMGIAGGWAVDKGATDMLNSYRNVWKSDLYGATKDGDKQFQEMVKRYQGENGLMRKPEEMDNARLKEDLSAKTQASGTPEPAPAPSSADTGKKSTPMDDHVTAVAEDYNLNPRLLHAVWQQESSGGKNTKSDTGVQGDFQITSGVMKELGMTPEQVQRAKEDPKENALVAGRWFSRLKRFATAQGLSGDDVEAYQLASYHSGYPSVNGLIKKYGKDWQDHLSDLKAASAGDVDAQTYVDQVRRKMK